MNYQITAESSGSSADLLRGPKQDFAAPHVAAESCTLRRVQHVNLPSTGGLPPSESITRGPGFPYPPRVSTTMPLDLATVHKVASLARLELTDQEAAQLQAEMDQILLHMQQLDSIDTSDIEPLAHAADVSDRMRNDINQHSIARDQALANAPAQDGEHFLVPPVFGPDTETA